MKEIKHYCHFGGSVETGPLHCFWGSVHRFNWFSISLHLLLGLQSLSIWTANWPSPVATWRSRQTWPIRHFCSSTGTTVEKTFMLTVYQFLQGQQCYVAFLHHLDTRFTDKLCETRETYCNFYKITPLCVYTTVFLYCCPCWKVLKRNKVGRFCWTDFKWRCLSQGGQQWLVCIRGTVSVCSGLDVNATMPSHRTTLTRQTGMLGLDSA